MLQRKLEVGLDGYPQLGGSIEQLGLLIMKLEMYLVNQDPLFFVCLRK